MKHLTDELKDTRERSNELKFNIESIGQKIHLTKLSYYGAFGSVTAWFGEKFLKRRVMNSQEAEGASIVREGAFGKS